MNPETLTRNGALPAEIIVQAGELSVGFTPRELRMIRETLGRSWSQIVADETTDDKFTVFAWLQLRREGHNVGLDALDDVVIRINAAPPDPTTNAQPTTSPDSVVSGG